MEVLGLVNNPMRLTGRLSMGVGPWWSLVWVRR